MKNKLKIPSKLKRSKKTVPPQPKKPESVTASTVEKHREDILSKGRRFKYPFQKSKRRVAFSSILLVILALGLFGLAISLQLYRWQGTSDLTYRATQIFPFPVASVDGKRVSYESYLFELRSNLYWERNNGQIDLNSPDGKRQIDFYKRKSLDKAIMITLAKKLAKENGVSVSDEEVSARTESTVRTGSGKLGQILRDSLNLTESEMNRYYRDQILQQKITTKLDTDAPKRAQTALAEIRAGQSFGEVAKKYSDDEATKQADGQMGSIKKTSANLPAEVVDALFKLEQDKVSNLITTNDGYYIVKVNKKVDSETVDASVIRVLPKSMSTILKEYRDQHKVKEYINVPTFSQEGANRSAPSA